MSFRLSTRLFGELLIERGRLKPEQLNEALASRQPRERLGQTLVRLGLLDERDVVELLGEQFSLPIADAETLSKAEADAVAIVPEHLARQSLVLALRRSDSTLEVAVGDPLDVVSLDHLRALTGCQLKIWLARPTRGSGPPRRRPRSLKRSTCRVPRTWSRMSISPRCGSRSRTPRWCGS